MPRRFALGALGLVLLLSGCVDSSPAPSSGGGDGGPVVPRGCPVGSPPPVAPGGYYTNGTTVCSADGTPHLFHGVDRPSLEWGAGEHISASDFQTMADWHANVVRVGLNQDFWLAGAALHMDSYQDRVDQVVHFAESVGLDVILDLHWSDHGDLSVTTLHGQDQAGTSNLQQMADLNSLQFWIEVATKYQNDGHVLFELYNEPNEVSWNIWLNGGPFDGYQVVGMQALYDAVRATGANNVVIAGGLSYAFDLSGVGANPIKGYNVMYASHPYKPQDPAARWERMFGYLATQDIAPVMTTEFGDGSTGCTGAWDEQLIQFADAHQISWSAWAWYAGGCKFPSLISDWAYTTTVQGDAVKAALLAYPYLPAGVISGGTDADTSDASTTDSGDASTTGGGPPSGSGGPASDAGPEAGAGGSMP